MVREGEVLWAFCHLFVTRMNQRRIDDWTTSHHQTKYWRWLLVIIIAVVVGTMEWSITIIASSVAAADGRMS
jgi:hypothetical protein